MPKPLGPSPDERSNWDDMNEGQKRYAMEQWHLARVRRGEKFDAPGEGFNEEEQQAIDDFDIDLLGTPQEQPGETDAEDAAIDNFLDQIKQNQDNKMADSSYITPTKPPPVQGVKRGGTGQGGKHGKIQKSGTSLPGTGGNLDGMSSGGSEEGTPVVFRPIESNVHTMIKTYNKKWRFLTSGNANIILNDPANADTNSPVRWALTTGMASIPWEYAFMYMSPAEFARMKDYPGTFAKHCSIKITCWNTRVAFQTGDTQTANATLNQNKFLQIAKGIRSIPFISSSNRKYTYSTTEPMLPTGFATQTSITYRDNLQQAMYGLANNSSSFTTRPPSDATGAEIYLQDYLTIYTNQGTASLAGFPPYKNFIEELDASSCVNSTVAEMQYNFDYAPMVPHFSSVPMNNISSTETDTLVTGTKPEVSLTKEVRADQTIAPILAANNTRKYLQGNNADTNYFDASLNYSAFPMEQNGVFEEVNRMTSSDSQQPSINIGIRSVPKLTTLDNATQATSWLDTQGYFEVECHLTTESHDPYTYILANCKSSNTKSQLQYFTNNLPMAHTYDFPNSYGRMKIVAIQ